MELYECVELLVHHPLVSQVVAVSELFFFETKSLIVRRVVTDLTGLKIVAATVQYPPDGGTSQRV